MKLSRLTCMIVYMAIPILLVLSSCAPIHGQSHSKQVRGDYRHLLQQGERQATPAGRKVLETGRRMTLAQKVIITGGCWGYANAVYNRAGYTTGKRKRVFSGRQGRAPFADTRLIQPGDWLYYSNHSYRGIEHSAIFVAWIDRGRKIALMLSYGGESRREPARYKAYDLSSVYRIERPRP